MPVHCPHCESPVRHPPHEWIALMPWHCSSCGNLFGFTMEAKTFLIPAGFLPIAPILGRSRARTFASKTARDAFYVYALCYPSGLPFYVGTGSKFRLLSHEDEYASKPPEQWTEKDEVINMLLKRNENVWYHFLSMTRKRSHALNIEAYWIREWGVRSKGGMLTNIAIPSYLMSIPSEQIPITEFFDQRYRNTDDIRSFRVEGYSEIFERHHRERIDLVLKYEFRKSVFISVGLVAAVTLVSLAAVLVAGHP